MDKLVEQIFNISNEEAFNKIALEVFSYQMKHVELYRKFVQSIGKTSPKHYLEIPFLPISFFKTHRIIADGQQEEQLFLSSGTTGSTRSHHYVLKKSLYEESFTKAYKTLIGNPKDQVILALLPNYVDQGNSSLVYMVDHLVQQSNSKLSGFLLNELDEIEKRYQEALTQGKQIVIFGVSYALLDLAEKKIDLSKALIIETGGMKGRRKEMSKQELHEYLQEGLNVPYIASEYGMTELLSQGYSNKNGLFTSPPWMKICVRDINDPFTFVQNGKSGGINVIDLANLYSCSFIATEDLGKVNGQEFELLGRIDLSDIRGCNLLIQ